MMFHRSVTERAFTSLRVNIALEQIMMFHRTLTEIESVRVSSTLYHSNINDDASPLQRENTSKCYPIDQLKLRSQYYE